MFPNLNPHVSMRTLSIGNVVTAGLRLYLFRLKSYFIIALQACLWLIIPIYGWAKFSAGLAMISRLAFKELIRHPETTKATRSYTYSRMSQFLITGILVNIILVLFISILAILELFGLGILAIILERVLALSSESFTFGLIALVSVLITIITFIIGVNWAVSRLIIAELPLAIENNINSIKTIRKGWRLTKGFITTSRIQGILILAVLIICPLLIVLGILCYLPQMLIDYLIASDSTFYSNISNLLNLAIIILFAAFLIPFIQTLKAVLYYDLVSRREGFGLQLRSEKFEEENYKPPLLLFNRVTLQTPESVELEFTLAGIGNRAWALVIDYSVLGLVLLLFWIGWIALSIQLVDFLNDFFRNYSIRTWLLAIALLIHFFIYTGYFVLFETLWQGQTPGKRFAQIRVIGDDAKPVGLQQATLRSLLRPVDDILFLGAFLIMFARREKRLGDLVAGTIVIQAESSTAVDTFAISEQAKLVCKDLLEVADLSAFMPDDFAVVREYLQRRKGLEPQARRQLSLHLATQLQSMLALQEIPENVTADLFIEAVYLAYQQQSSNFRF